MTRQRLVSADELQRLADAETWPRPTATLADTSPALPFIDPTAWEGVGVPPRRWLVANRIPMSNVTLLYGDGAVGKTTIGLQLAVGVSCRLTDWLGGLIDNPGPVIVYTAEEDTDELHRRLAAILEHHRLAYRDLVDLHLLSLPDRDPTLGSVERGGIVQPTPMFLQLEQHAVSLKPSLIIIEAAADVFAGDEVLRNAARHFVGLLRRLAIKSSAAVLLLCHPSLSGMASGSGTSGSTAWSNSARSRLYFSAVPDTDIRELKVMKSNYGPAGETVRLRWQDGVFLVAATPSATERAAADAKVDDVFLKLLDAVTAQGRRVSPKKSNTYAPATFEAMPAADGIKRSAFGQSMERLFTAGRIKVETDGPPSKRRDAIVRA